GGTRWHSLITLNVGGELRQALKKGSCFVFDPNLRVKIEATGLYTYPDVVVTCEEPRFVDGEMDTLLNPTLLVEVLSQTTEAYDRGRKAEHYRQIQSLREYLLVSQSQPRIEQYFRQPNADWVLRETVGLEREIKLVSLKISIPLAEIFSRIKFPASP